MPNALDAFRAQKEAAEHVHARLEETEHLLRSLREQVNALTADRALAELLQREHEWLRQFEATMDEVRRFRALEAQRFWPGVMRRWLLAFSLALLGAWAYGAGRVWATRPYASEIAMLRERAELFDYVTERVLKMTPAERRQFEALLK